MAGAPSFGKISTLIWRIARIELSAIEITATKIVTGLFNAINTSHIPSSLVYSTSALPAGTVPDRREKRPKLGGLATRAVAPASLQSPPATVAFGHRQRP